MDITVTNCITISILILLSVLAFLEFYREKEKNKHLEKQIQYLLDELNKSNLEYQKISKKVNTYETQKELSEVLKRFDDLEKRIEAIIKTK